MQVNQQLPAAFSVQIGGVQVRMDSSWEAQFHASSAVYPLPTASQRVVGLMQVRGEIVPVFDASAAGSIAQGKTAAHNVLVIKVAEKWLGVIVRAEPTPLPGSTATTVSPPDSIFADALSNPRMANDGSGSIWWSLDAQQFFEQLSKEISLV